MLAIFLAPFSGGMKINKAEAQNTTGADTTEIKKLTGGEYVTISVPDKGIGYASAIFDVKIIKTPGTISSYILDTSIIRVFNDSTLTKAEEEAQIVSTEEYVTTTISSESERTIEICFGADQTDKHPKCDSTLLTKNTSYKLKVKFYRSDNKQEFVAYYQTFRTGDEKTSGASTGNTQSYYNVAGDFGCSLNPLSPDLGGCILEILYLLWQASAWVATLAGGFLDFFVYYSTDSASYTNTFVSQGWGAVRDIANILFIISLLYVAIKTILGLNVTDNKKIVGAVIVIALIINFSLFTTKVVIDASNILAKVFYNNITSTKEGTTDAATGNAGEKSISVGLVDKFNPQNIVMDAYNTGLGLGYAIFIILLLMAITLYTAYIFFSVAILFAARVVSLWISMIFSPLAFVSYAVPFEIPEFGHKEWWDNLLKNAFLAPIFVFMLYIIVLFAKFLTTIAEYTSDPSISSTTNALRRLMTITIPFIILMMLLRMAKDIAVKYSGELGAALMKGAQMVGGLALGAATGGAAMAARGTVGKLGTKLASSEWAIKRAKEGKMGAMILGSTLGRASFDARGIKIAGKGLADTGLTNVGKAKEGGFEKKMEDQEMKRRQRAADLDKIVERSKAKKDLNKVEDDHQNLLMKNGNAFKIEQIDKKIEAANKASSSAQAALRGETKGTPAYDEAQKAVKAAASRVLDLQGERGAIKNATMFITSDGKIIDHRENTFDGNLSENAIAGIAKTSAKALAASIANPGNVDLANASTIADAANYAAIATQSATAAVANPANAALAATAAADQALAATAERAVAALAAANPANADLAKAATAAANALAKTTNGLTGRSINNFEDDIIPGAKHHLENEKRGVRGGYINQIKERKFANLMFNPGYSGYADDEAIHKIRMETKLDSGAKGH